jgi:hypothetical protein
MKFLIGFLLLLFFYISTAFSQECPLPRQYTCVMSPGNNHSHIFIKINFTKNKSRQIVYLDSGCERDITRFTPLSSNENRYDINPDADLRFMLCVDGKLINTTEVKLNSSSDISIICDFKNKLVCKKHEKKKSFWEYF